MNFKFGPANFRKIAANFSANSDGKFWSVKFSALFSRASGPPKTPRPKVTPKIVGIPLPFHFLSPTFFHANVLLTGETNNSWRFIPPPSRSSTCVQTGIVRAGRGLSILVVPCISQTFMLRASAFGGAQFSPGSFGSFWAGSHCQLGLKPLNFLQPHCDQANTPPDHKT